MRCIFGRLHLRAGAQQGDAAAGQNAFFDGCAGGVQGVFDAGLLFLHFALGRGADVDLGHAAGQLRQALFELLAIVVAGGVVDLAADLVDAAFDVGALAAAFDDRRVVLVDDDLLGAAELIERDAFELDAEVFEDGLAAGEDGDVFEHGLAAIAEAGGLDGTDVERAAELVDDERGEGFAFDVFGDDQERLAGVDDGFRARARGL